jgi:hypothetical protein
MTNSDSFPKAFISLVDEILKRTCPECGKTFTDPNEWAFGHDCEEESE